jgi:hypothetical protein
VLLNYVNYHDSIQRATSVIKSRAGHHQPRIRKFLIGRDGIVLADSHPSEGASDNDRLTLPGSKRGTGN